LNEFSPGSTDDDPIVLVDAHDVPQGVAPKIEVHRRGLKHRAISVLVRNRAGDMLVHRRHADKYHSGGLCEVVPVV
jgi:isopentenyl-diphosphate delta-isomerase